jgi:hypothetical protein
VLFQAFAHLLVENNSFLRKILLHIKIFARMAPKQKVFISYIRNPVKIIQNYIIGSTFSGTDNYRIKGAWQSDANVWRWHE